MQEQETERKKENKTLLKVEEHRTEFYSVASIMG